MSLYEKTAWASLVVVVVTAGWYMVNVLGEGGPDDLAGIFAEMVALVVVIVAIEIIAQIVIVVTTRKKDKDERDVAIEGRAAIYGQLAVFVGVFWVIIQVVIDGIWLFDTETISRVAVVNSLLIALVVGEIVNLGTQIVLYRRTA